MKRRRPLNTGVLLLLLGGGGAIVNVAVAWGCATYPQANHTSRQNQMAAGQFRIIGGGQTGNAELFNELLVLHPPRYGWPMKGLCMAPVQVGKDWLIENSHQQLAGVDIYSPLASNSKPFRLPTQLVWPGFAINTIFYAAILWVVWFTPGMARRRIRRRRGLCPACAYPVGTSPVCTECGKALT